MDILLLIGLLVGAFWFVVEAWSLAKRWLNDESLPARPVSRETPAEALARQKRLRVRAEHQQWDSQFHALAHGDKCPVCSGPKRRSASRYSIYT
jgi:hypothetical protein